MLRAEAETSFVFRIFRMQKKKFTRDDVVSGKMLNESKRADNFEHRKSDPREV